MDILPGAAEAGERLKRTALRDFGPAVDPHENETSFRLTIHPNDCPLPGLYKYALTLIGLEAHGPGEKVAWWVDFTYKGERCTLAFQKVGLRIYLRIERSEEEAVKSLGEVSKKLRTCMRTIEKVLLEAAPDILGRGSATSSTNIGPSGAPTTTFESAPRTQPTSRTRTRQAKANSARGAVQECKLQMQIGSFHDMVATISAYLSLAGKVTPWPSPNSIDWPDPCRTPGRSPTSSRLGASGSASAEPRTTRRTRSGGCCSTCWRWSLSSRPTSSGCAPRRA